MNIRGVATMLGAVDFARIPNGQQVVDKINVLLPDDQKIDVTFTGEQLGAVLGSLQPQLLEEISKVEVLSMAESIRITSQVRVADGSASKDFPVRKAIALIIGLVLAFISLLLVSSYVYTVFTSDAAANADLMTTLINALTDIIKTLAGTEAS